MCVIHHPPWDQRACETIFIEVRTPDRNAWVVSNCADFLGQNGRADRNDFARLTFVGPGTDDGLAPPPSFPSGRLGG